MKYFNDLSEAERREFFNSIELVLSDCDGVLWRGEPIAGSGEVINRLREMGKKVALISNNSFYPLSHLKKRVQNANIRDFPDEDMIMPTVTVINYLKSIDFRKKIFSVCSPAMIESLQESGYHCDDGSMLNPKEAIQQTSLDSDVGAVIIDSNVTYNYMTLAKAVHYLKNKDVLFIAGATDSWLPFKPEVILLGPGYFLELVAKASERQPIVLGKPGDGLGEFLTMKYSIKDPKKVLFIGDSMEQDITFAQRQGYRSLLVLSGMADLEAAENGLKAGVISADGKTEEEAIKSEFYLHTLANLAPTLDQV